MNERFHPPQMELRYANVDYGLVWIISIGIHTRTTPKKATPRFYSFTGFIPSYIS